MRFVLTIAALWLAGVPAQAQIQLLPGRVAPAHPAAKAPRPDREAATRGNFPRRLKRDEIEALFFTGAPVEATGLGRAQFRVTFLKNGEAERLDHKTNQTERGKWRFLGDGYCSKWGKAYESCYTIVKDGETYKVVRGTRAVAFWTPPGGTRTGPSSPAPAQVEAPERSAAPSSPETDEEEADSEEDEEESEQ